MALPKLYKYIVYQFNFIFLKRLGFDKISEVVQMPIIILCTYELKKQIYTLGSYYDINNIIYKHIIFSHFIRM